MMKVAVMLVDGFEEIEATTIIDVLRRAGIDAAFVGLNSDIAIGAHNVSMKADVEFNKVNFDDFDMIVLPGGLPGAEYLAKSEKLQKVLKDFDEKGKFIGAICAAPWALKTAGVLRESYTCYPGFEKVVAKDGYTPNLDVVIDKNIITSRGPATAMKFALELVKILEGDSKYTEVKNGLLY
ncbi:DJ-1 family glyoxalase III [Campylobacter fetus]|uniref:Thiamine biosynthesis protein ThiJ n=1 Tax=Campylobacter fetus subsp. testudinum TaxID=1507806 RepID=A0AAX0HDM0_CAMFE|nr:DJ-1 family glyoxalase III [Campylobacter fetus]OCR91708.1 thiamine biosynthesis protein ThiJ [Campylobacter fetus subsp. testudinum]OCS04857.1 thiamine biosynthesis protein ThiJ [Campylobacter fetus subsp. testudinum]